METFTLPVLYKGEQFLTEAKFVRLGFIHQFHVMWNEYTLIFELDEEREYRVLAADPRVELKNIDIDLIESIVTAIRTLH